MQCPVCKAENTAGPQCRRCRADLSLLFALEREQERRRAAVTLLLARDFAAAWQMYQHPRATERP